MLLQHCATAVRLPASRFDDGVSVLMGQTYTVCVAYMYGIHVSTNLGVAAPPIACCAGSFADKVSRQTAAASSLASSVADQIAIRQTETRTQSHTAGFEVSTQTPHTCQVAITDHGMI